VSERRGAGRGSRRRGGRGTRWRWLAALGFVLLLVSTAAAGFWFWSRRPSGRGVAFTLTLRGDENVRALREDLERAGLLDHPLLFEAYLELARARSRLKPGPHLLRPGLSPAELVARLTRSAARRRVKLTIPEGFNRFQIADRIEKLELASSALFLAETEDEAHLHELGVAAPTAEGYLFPATYELPVDSEPQLLVSTLIHEAKRRLERLLPLKAARLNELWQREGWGEREALTLASIVEREAADRREHGNIASVFYNRLTDTTFRPRRMLQSDATAAYGCLTERAEIESCRDYAGLVTPAMLRDATNPYNTYKHAGLPPGPIGNPSESAILSVLDPPQTPYFFFVAGAAKRHVFSRTFSEHERAIVTGVPATEGPDGPASAREGGAAGN
jgi:peptidoglycan lytic transglycosylase G